MTKGQFLMIRIDHALKARVEQAATRRGQSMTAFVSQALETAIRRAEAAPPPSTTRTFRGVPTFFRAACATASQGGTNGYALAGRTLARHLRSLLEQEHESAAVDTKLLELRVFLDEHRDAEALSWFQREFPGCMALVPREKRVLFVQGVCERHENEGDVIDVAGGR